MISDFKSFNENVLNIDLKKIKDEAYKFSKSRKCVLMMSEIEPSLLLKVEKEFQFVLKKYKSIENLVHKIYQKFYTKNEMVTFGSIVFTAFGIHAFLKLLGALKDNYSFLKYLDSLFNTRYSELKSARDFIISVTFVLYLITYIVQSKSKSNDYYFIPKDDVYINMPFEWDGLQNLKIYDGIGKEYLLNRKGAFNFDVIYNNRVIGHFIGDYIYNTKGDTIIKDVSLDNTNGISMVSKYDLEKILSNNDFKGSKLNIMINKDKAEIKRLSTEIDSLRNKEYTTKKVVENIDQAKKYLGDNYDTQLSDPNSRLSTLKKILEENNNTGYFGLFTKFIYKDGIHYQSVIELYINHILPNKNILNKLRDTNGNLKQLVEFNTFESLCDALRRLEDWLKVNKFIKQLPPTQKNLIWENGNYKPSVKAYSQFITSSILKIIEDEKRTSLFMSKISSIKDAKTFITLLGNSSNSEPWDYDYWIEKLNSLKNIVVTWSSKEHKQIICAIFSFSAIKKIAYMTNWCIYRERDYFKNYSSKGYQLMFFDFNKPESDNKSVIGFTIRFNYAITDCNNKSDRYTTLPDKFTEIDNYGLKHEVRIVKKEYITMSTGQLIKKIPLGAFKIIRTKIRHLLNTSKNVSSFIDWYNKD